MSAPVSSRRAFLEFFASVGLGTTLLPGVLWAHVASGGDITSASIASAAELAGLEFDDDERALMVAGLTQQEKQLATLHDASLTNDVVPAIPLDPLITGTAIDRRQQRIVRAPVAPRAVPASLAELAFLPVTELSALVQWRAVTSLHLTQLALDRLEQFDPTLHCVVTLTADRALARARAADEELSRGRRRGPLHGIPWGAKDLLAVKGYPTTWGTAPYRTQMLDEDATVVRRLDAAGAVLVPSSR